MGEVVPSVFWQEDLFVVLWRSSTFGDYAVLRGRMQSIFGELWIGVILEVLSLEIEQGASPCPFEDFGGVWGRYFGGFSSVAAQGLEG